MPAPMSSISTKSITIKTISRTQITIQATASQSVTSKTMPTTSYQPLVEIRKTMPMDTGKQADSNNWHTFEGKSYKFIDLKMKRAQALMYCKRESGRMAGLVIIDRKEQNEFVKNLAFKDNTDHTTIHMGLRFHEHKITIEFTQVVVGYDNFNEDHLSAIMAGTGDECIYMERSGYWVTGVCDSDDNYQFVCWD